MDSDDFLHWLRMTGGIILVLLWFFGTFAIGSLGGWACDSGYPAIGIPILVFAFLWFCGGIAGIGLWLES